MDKAATVERHSPAVIVGTILVTGAILALRKPDALLNPQFIAEDGELFFFDAFKVGLAAIFHPYAGYLHVVPRLIAAMASAFDPALIPAIYNYSAFLLNLAVPLALFSPRIHLPAKPALALAIALLPHTGEVFIHLTNVQWLLAPGLCLLLLTDDPQTLHQRFFDWVTLIVLGLTGPFIIFLLPLFLWRAYQRRSRESVIMAGLATVVAGIQFFLLLQYRTALAQPTPSDPAGLLTCLSGRLYATFWGAYRYADLERHAILAIIGIGLTGIGTWLAFRKGPWQQRRQFLGLAWLLMVLPVAARFLHTPESISFPLSADRYFVIPHLLLAWLIVLSWKEFTGWKRLACTTALATALVTNLPFFRSPAWPDHQWATRVQPIRERKAFDIPINPTGWYVSTSRDRHQTLPR